MSKMFDLDPPYLLDKVFPAFSKQENWMSYQYAHHMRPLAHESVYIKSWLQSAMAEFDLKPTSLAKRAGIAPSTLNRFLDEEVPTGSLNARTISKISKIFEEEIKVKVHEEWAQIERETDGAEVQECQLLGDVDEFRWQKILTKFEERDERGPYPVITAPVAFPYVEKQVACFNVKDDFYDPIFNRLDTIFCSPISQLKSPPEGEQYVVVIEAGHRREFRAFLRQYIMDPTGRGWLIPIGTIGMRDIPAILMDGPSINGDDKKVVFTVIGVHRHFRPPGIARLRA